MSDAVQSVVRAGSPAVAPAPEPSDESLARLARTGDLSAFELLMRRNNQRVYRTVRSVLRDGSEVEDAMQDAYTSAFAHLDQFEGTGSWAAWLCRIAFNEALARVRLRGRFVSIEAEGEERRLPEDSKPPSRDPERSAITRELGQLVEHAVDRLPDIYRNVLMLRQIEGLDTTETAAVLGVDEAVVKTRLHRARALLKADIEQRIGDHLESAFTFGASRCNRVVAAVLGRLAGK